MKKINFNGHLLIASSSSVYGASNKKIFNENDKSDQQLSLYAASKKSLESIAHSYSYNFNFNTSVMRFFTVYGPWGRPDMAIFKFTKAILNKTEIELYNSGNLWRDFTYVNDLVFAIKKLSTQSKKILSKGNLSNKIPFRIINIGNQKLVKITRLIQIIEAVTKQMAKIRNLPLQQGDVKYTLSDSNLLLSLINYTPNTSIDTGYKIFYEWYSKYY